MADCKLRDEQFKIIEEQRRYCDEHGIPVFSVDTKKKELLGPYRHDDGKAYTTDPVKVYDHDYSTFSNGKMVPYGIYDVTRNTDYPPYCSKWNPIEHRLFSQISRVWSGAVFNTIEEASELASRARTKTGLAVFTSINRRIYETKTERNPLFESECDRHIVKDEILPKWNYLVRCN